MVGRSMLEGIGRGVSPLILWIRIGSDVRSSWSWLSFECLFVCNRGSPAKEGVRREDGGGMLAREC